MTDQTSNQDVAKRSEIDVTPKPQTLEGEYAEVLPTSDKGYRRLGFVILLLAFGGFGTWAMTGSLAVAVVAPGNVSVESFKRSVQHLEGGIVSEILVEDGQHVEAGDPLVVLSDTQARSQLEIARSQYLINRAMEVRLLAEQEGADALEFPRSWWRATARASSRSWRCSRACSWHGANPCAAPWNPSTSRASRCASRSKGSSSW